MFDFDPGDDLELIVQTAKSFAVEQLLPNQRLHERSRSVPPSIRKTYAGMGLAGLELPEAFGGVGLGALARVLVNEEIAAGDAGAALALDPLGPAVYPLIELGGDEALQCFVLPLLAAERARAVLVSENDIALDLGSTVSGTIPWVPADQVDLLVILRGDDAVVVREGLDCRELRGGGLRAAGASELRLQAAPIAARWNDPAGAARALARARLYMASLLVGVLRQGAEFSRQYALEREAFGRPIGHHQGLAFLIADMRSAVDGARLLLHEAAWRVDQGHAGGAAAAAAFAEAVEASLLVGPNCVQILGGHGFMQDYPVEKYMRESRLLGLSMGGLDAAREVAGDAIVGASSTVSLSCVAD